MLRSLLGLLHSLLLHIQNFFFCMRPLCNPQANAIWQKLNHSIKMCFTFRAARHALHSAPFIAAWLAHACRFAAVHHVLLTLTHSRAGLPHAITSSWDQILRLLIEQHGADVNAAPSAACRGTSSSTSAPPCRCSSRGLRFKDSPPLIVAAHLGLTESLAVLLAAGADVHATNTLGHTALHEVACAPAAVLLLAAGANVNASDSGWTPLHAVCGRAPNPNPNSHAAAAGGSSSTQNSNSSDIDDVIIELISVLVAAGADLEAACSETGSRPLHVAVTDGRRLRVVRALLAAGANARAVDKRGRTPLAVAMVDKSVPGMKRIISALTTHMQKMEAAGGQLACVSSGRKPTGSGKRVGRGSGGVHLRAASVRVEHAAVDRSARMHF